MERGPASQAINDSTPVGSGREAFSGSGNYSSRSASLWILLLSLALLLLQISNQSLWIDEGDTASYALQPDLHAWVQRLVHDPIPDCQMPLTMWTAWLGAHSLGSAEWQLRVINLLWAAGALLAMFYAGKCLGLKWLPAVLAIQPYFWFYNDQARPYALEICCGTLLLLGVALFWREQGRGAQWAWAMAGGAVLLGYTTILAPFPLFAVGAICAVVAFQGRWRIERRAWLPLLLGAALLLPVGAYYYWTIRRGVSFPVLWKSDWKGFCYLFYELTGLSGLGPSLMEIREAAQAKVLPTVLKGHLPELALAGLTAVCWLLLLALTLRQLVRERRWHTLGLLIAIPLLAGGTLTLSGLYLKKMLWARHWAPVFPFYAAAMALVLEEQIHNRVRRWSPGRLVGVVWIITMIVSAFSFRFAAKHEKDDYRGAAALARQYLTAGRPVLWVASWDCARYYGLPVGPGGPEDKSITPLGCRLEPAGGTPATMLPVVFLSRPSIYDPTGAVRAYVEQNSMSCDANRCRAFWIYLPQTSSARTSKVSSGRGPLTKMSARIFNPAF